jgi:hypothetical protein
MGNLDNALQELRAERKQAHLQAEKLDKAISVIESLNGTGTSGHATQPIRTVSAPPRVISAASRRKMGLAQKARWAKIRKEGQLVLAAAKTTAPAPVAKRIMSPSARRKIAAFQRTRWAKLRADGCNPGFADVHGTALEHTASAGLDSDINLNLEPGMATGVGRLIFRFQGLFPPLVVQRLCVQLVCRNNRRLHAAAFLPPDDERSSDFLCNMISTRNPLPSLFIRQADLRPSGLRDRSLSSVWELLRAASSRFLSLRTSLACSAALAREPTPAPNKNNPNAIHGFMAHVSHVCFRLAFCLRT